MKLFAFAQSKLQFGLAIGKIHADRHERKAFFRHFANQLPNFPPVQQQFSGESVALVNNQLYANHIKVEHTKFKATSLAVYVWLLLRHRDGLSAIRYKSKDDSGNLSYSKELMAVYRQLHGEKGINKMETVI